MHILAAKRGVLEQVKRQHGYYCLKRPSSQRDSLAKLVELLTTIKVRRIQKW